MASAKIAIIFLQGSFVCRKTPEINRIFRGDSQAFRAKSTMSSTCGQNGLVRFVFYYYRGLQAYSRNLKLFSPYIIMLVPSTKHTNQTKHRPPVGQFVFRRRDHLDGKTQKKERWMGVEKLKSNLLMKAKQGQRYVRVWQMMGDSCGCQS